MTRRNAPDWLTKWEYAHRGLHSPGVPENSLAAARAAMAAGMGIECDIQRTLDKQPMVFHDWELGRLTDGSGLTEVFSAEELEALFLQDSEERPLRLSRLLEEVAGKVPLLIEIKSRPEYDVERTCLCTAEMLKDYDGEHAVMSFDYKVGEWFAANSPETVRGLVCTDTLDLGFLGAWRASGAIESAAPDFLAMDIRDLPSAIPSMWRESGRPLLSWTVRSAELREHALAHVDALISEGEGLA
ncbi:glycerophosphoryl diester phosphodiesterase [Erythrobacter sp. NAP1]|uniref:glycerophosphodiester phosphodiesterase family protein n=1 Tax=Erythrobacter sp. NAP1 TaxID=237727 RepID=UPI000068779B|nr:glycerophosphodiester phosphodiesterase family protein [Erythrobacter sp. NAP1]EAQ28325.1 glycerophosphoryl diester phosphodiesterase [Erythrobacter sp. NAP1]